MRVTIRSISHIQTGTPPPQNHHKNTKAHIARERERVANTRGAHIRLLIWLSIRMLLGWWWPGCCAVLLVVVDVPWIFTTNNIQESNKIMLTASNGLQLCRVQSSTQKKTAAKTHISLPNVNKIKNNNKMTWPICNKSVLYNITSYTLSNGMCMWCIVL